MTTFDDPDERARQVFTPIVRATLVVGALGLVVIAPFTAVNKTGAVILSLVAFAAAAIAWVCMRFDRPRLGTAIIVGMFWAVQTGLLLLSQGAFIGSAYVFCALLAGAALGARAALIVGSLGVAALAATTALSLAGITPPLRASCAVGCACGLCDRDTHRRHLDAARFHPANGNRLRDRRTRGRRAPSYRAGSGATRRATSKKRSASAQMGSWHFDVATGVHHWSRQHFRIHGLDPDTTPPSFRVMIERVPARGAGQGRDGFPERVFPAALYSRGVSDPARAGRPARHRRTHRRRAR